MEEKRKMADGSERKNDWAAASRKLPILEQNGSGPRELDLVYAQQAHLPFTNEKFLCARRRISLSKYTRKPMTHQRKKEGEGEETCCRSPQSVPRMVSFRSEGMPAHKLLRPSTIARHSSRAACSPSAPEGSRCASSVLRASKGVPSGAGGIKRTRRERMSPARGVAGR